MGYTTEFSGHFTLSEPLDEVDAIFVQKLSETDNIKHMPVGTPDAWLQWILKPDRKTVIWDGNEKFYKYKEWLQWLIDNVFATSGRELSGSVIYRGEEHSDIGTLKIENGKVVQTAAVFK